MKGGLRAGAGSVLALAAAALLYGLAARFPARLDLSRGGIYTLSEPSRKLVRELKDPVLVRAYFTAEDALPAEYRPVRQYLEGLLQQYAHHSGGKLRYEFVPVDGEENEEGLREALSEGVQPVRFTIHEGEKFEVRQGVLGLVLRHLDKKETLPLVLDPAASEYELTSRILKMTRTSRPVLGFVGGAGAVEPAELPPQTRAALEEAYEFRQVDLDAAPDGAVPEEVAALALLGPTRPLSEGALRALDRFLASGRPLAVAADNRSIDLRVFSSSLLKTGLQDWLARYGIRVRPGAVFDRQNQKVQVTTRQGWFQVANIVDYPPMVLAAELDREHPVTRKLPSIVLPFSAAIEVSSGPLRARALARSSEESWLARSWESGFVNLNPFQDFVRGSDDPGGPFDLAVQVEGPFGGEGAPEGRLLVLGTSHFIRGEGPLTPANHVFFLNMADWLLSEPELIAIRSKSVGAAPLRPLSRGQKLVLRWLLILLPPFAVTTFGLWRWRRRELWRESRPAAYGLAG